MRAYRMALLAAAALAGCPGGGHHAPADGPTTFVVMTQNLYLGADLDAALSPGANLPDLVERAWASAQATDFPSRAKLVADAIQTAGADLVGLQEAALWRTQTPGDGSLIPNATTVRYDFLDLLQTELRARGLDYQVAAVVVNGDIELAGTSGTDYRLTDRDAILARSTIPIVSTSSGTYPVADLYVVAGPPLTPGGPPTFVSLPRGWVSVDFRAGGNTLRLVNTHLEALSEDVAARQAADLVNGVAHPSQQTTIVIGDMNSTPDSPGYGVLAAPATGMGDAWTEAGSGAGLTCCWNPDLQGGAFFDRIDLVFHTVGVRPTQAAVVDDQERTSTGLHASDHAGVAVGFTTSP